MQFLIWIGAAVTLVGVGLLAASALQAGKVRRDVGLAPEAGKVALTRALYLNMAGLGVAFLGLMAVVVGLILT